MDLSKGQRQLIIWSLQQSLITALADLDRAKLLNHAEDIGRLEALAADLKSLIKTHQEARDEA
jgi:hypothetical protein